MPVKIRCRGCEKVLNAPDEARGKIVKCPKCGSKLKVPGGAAEGTSKPASQPAPARDPAKKSAEKNPQRRPVKAAAPPPSSTEFFANLDFGQVEDTTSRVCPYCASDIDEDATVCPECGMNVMTGQMDRKAQIRKSRKGPDPAKFYKLAWTDSWAFLKEHNNLALRTGAYLSLFIVLSWACVAMVGFCTNGPPKTFWMACSFLAMMGLPGWFFYLSMKIVEYSMGKVEKMDRVHFDFFQCVTLGMRTIFWPAVILIPIWPIIIVIRPSIVFLPLYPILQILFPESSSSIWEFMPVFKVLAFVSIIPLLVLPLAIVHMTQRYTYKAWVLWELTKVFVNNAGPALYWVLMTVITFILPIGAILGAIQVYGGGANPFSNEYFLKWTAQLVLLAIESEESWMFLIVAGVVRLILAFVVATPVLILAGFPLVFLMRANGLLGYYRKQTLGLVNQMGANTPCGFWVRMLAFFVDVMLFPLASFIVVKERRALLIGQLLNSILLLSGIFLPVALPYIMIVWSVYMWWMYFCVQESTTQRTTIGKDGFGLIVSTENNKQLTLGKATGRFFSTFLTILTLFLGFVMCAFHPEKKALHDLISGTKCVWSGDK